MTVSYKTMQKNKKLDEFVEEENNFIIGLVIGDFTLNKQRTTWIVAGIFVIFVI